MRQNLSPAAVAVIVVVVVGAIGLLGWKMAFSPKGVPGKVPTYTGQTGGMGSGAAPPAGAPTPGGGPTGSAPAPGGTGGQ